MSSYGPHDASSKYTPTRPHGINTGRHRERTQGAQRVRRRAQSALLSTPRTMPMSRCHGLSMPAVTVSLSHRVASERSQWLLVVWYTVPSESVTTCELAQGTTPQQRPLTQGHARRECMQHAERAQPGSQTNPRS